jgi:aldehyde dehydrogenase
MERVLKRVAAIKQGNPLDTDTHDGRAGVEGTAHQDHVLPRPRQAGRRAGADRRRAGPPGRRPGEGGYYVQPTLFKGHNKMRIFQEEIFGPVLAVTTFKDEAEALAIANDTLYGLGAGVWSRDGNTCLSHGPCHQGRPRLDQLLPRLSRRTRPSAATSNPASAAKPTR